MREVFREWGAELSDADFACALAAAGVLWDWKLPRGEITPEFMASAIRSRLSPQLTLSWRLLRIPPSLSAGMLLQAWRSFRDSTDRGTFRIVVEPMPDDWIEQLSRPEVGAASVEETLTSIGGVMPPEDAPKGQAYSVTDDGMSREGYRSQGSRSLGSDKTREVFERMNERREQEPLRWLQGRIRSGSQDVQTLRREGAYEAVIRIGQADARWVSVEQPFAIPEEPPEPEGHWLTVIFWEPRVSLDPQIQPLLLPPEGNTEEIAFRFEVPAGLERIAARITVLHANRVLQTGVLRASVGDEGPWTFTLDATPRTRLEGLSNRSEFDVALVLNHDEEGTARVTAAAGDQAVVLDLDDGPLDQLTDFLRKQISKIAKAPERYETLSSPGTLELLRTLAQKGGAIREDLSNHTALPALDGAKRIQVTSAKVGSFLPIELLYQYEPPDETAGLCPNAAVALQAGECPGGCPADKRQHVCPLGFWGLSRVIERHTHTARNPAKEKGGDFLLQPEPVLARNPLALSNRSLLAASGRASEVKKEAVDELLQALGRRGTAARAASWPEWIQRVESDRPSLLVLLPHHEHDDGEEILEIGEGDRLKSSLIRHEHVRCEDGPYPILLLLGCETNLARIAFDNFATRFRDKKAAVVVSTIATILGRHASPAAARLVELLDEEAQEEGSTFGEVMVRLRRKLLETGSPMALGLTAYGDADWILTRKTDADPRNARRPLR